MMGTSGFVDLTLPEADLYANKGQILSERHLGLGSLIPQYR